LDFVAARALICAAAQRVPCCAGMETRHHDDLRPADRLFAERVRLVHAPQSVLETPIMSSQGRFVVNTRPLVFAIGVVFVGYAGVVLPACSSDEDEGSSSTAGTGGSGATGTGGASTGGTGTGGSGTGGSASTSITCGSLTCQAASGGFPIPPCCAGTAQDKCGFQIPTIGCQEENQAGDPDPSCTDAFNEALDGGVGAGGAAGASGFQLEGCCRPDGVCGVLINQGGLNLGCVDVSRYADGGSLPTCTP
jgi:hypothetical protein